MKKVLTYVFLIAFFSIITSCDFLRTVAGRPTSDVIAKKAEILEKRRRHVEDSLRVVEAFQQARRDSLQTVKSLAECGVRVSDVFYYGEPLTVLDHKYQLIIGVYKTSAMVGKQTKALEKGGYQCSSILFRGGVRALCPYQSDDLASMLEFVKEFKEAGLCPKDAWVHRGM